MKRISIVLLLLSAAAVSGCRKGDQEIDQGGKEEVFEIKPGMYQRSAAGFSWEFITPDANDPDEYFYTGSRKIYYAKASDGYARACTLRVTKTAHTTPSSVAFNVYDHEATCLTLSSGSSETGTTNYEVWTERMSGQLVTNAWKGYTWTLPTAELVLAPIGTYYEFFFTITLPKVPSSCPEGKVYARMKSPVDIPSVDSFWDGDAFSLSQNASR